MSQFFKKHVDTMGIMMGSIFFVGLGFMAQRLLEWDRPCLRFDGVIELHVDGYENGVRSCRQTSRFQTGFLPEQTQVFVESINELKRVQVLFPQNIRGVFVTITNKDPFFLLVSERSLVIGVEIAKNTKALQKAILSAVAFQSLSGFDTLGKELRTDLLWYLFADDDEWTDPTMGITVDPKEWMKLATAPQTVQDYCSSPLRQIYDLSFCRYELLKDQTLPVRKRYQSLISWTAYKTLKLSGLADSSDYLRSLFDSKYILPSSEIREEDGEISLEMAESYVRDEVRNLLVPDVSERSPAFDESFFDQEISQVWKPYKITSSGDFDFIVEVDNQGLMDTVLNSLTDWQKNSFVGLNSRILLVYGDEQLELPLAQRVNYPIDQVRSETHLVLACHLPGVQTVSNFKAENLIALQVCDPSELPQWADILKENAPANKTASLRLEVHLPSFKRWSRHTSEIIALNESLDSVLCQPEIFSGYPFKVENCHHETKTH